MSFLLNVFLIPPLIEDIKNRKIRNVYFILIFLFKILYLIIERDKQILLSSAVGFSCCGLIMLLGFVLSKDGIGSGDIKLLLSISFYLGSELFLRALLCISMMSLMFSLFLLATKKASKNTEVPFVPFIFVGNLISTCVEVFS